MLNPFLLANIACSQESYYIANCALLANPCVPPSFGGSFLCTVQCIYPLESFKLNIFLYNLVNFQATKMAHLILQYFK
jgi:hypothetical protein